MSRTASQRSSIGRTSSPPEPGHPGLVLVPAGSIGISDLPAEQDAFFGEIVEQARRATRASGAALAVEKDGKVICCARAGKQAPSLGAELDRDSGLSGLCLRAGEALRCDDATNDIRVDADAASHLGIRSILALPLKFRGATIGLLEVFSESSCAFRIEHEHLLEIAAERILLRHGELAGEPVAAGAILPATTQAVIARPPVVAVSESAFAGVEQDSAATWPKRRIAIWVAALALAAAAGLGVSLRTGANVPQPVAADPITAQARSLRQAAESGKAAAQFELAMRYRSGDGLPRNDGEAIRWLMQAARQGNGDAQFELGNAYADGRGVERDHINAYACYVLAAANGNLPGQQALKFLTPKLSEAQIAQIGEIVGKMYLQGRGTPADLIAAHTWFTLAESAGNAEAGREKQLLQPSMSAQQVAAANRHASDWLRRHRPRGR